MRFLLRLNPKLAFRRHKSRFRGAVVDNIPYGTGHIQYSCDHTTSGFWRARPAERYYTAEKCPACRITFKRIVAELKDWFQRAGEALSTIPVGPRERDQESARSTVG
jgi:hypothetical protein